MLPRSAFAMACRCLDRRGKLSTWPRDPHGHQPAFLSWEGLRERIEEKGSAPSEIITAPVTQGTDISHELGRRIQLPIFVEQVLPFMPQGDAHKYQVLGGYLLDTDGNADRRMPIMVVFERTKLEWEVSPKDFVLIEGLVVMANETERGSRHTADSRTGKRTWHTSPSG